MRAARPFDDFITLRSIRTPELTFRSAKKLVHDSRSSLRELATSPHELMTRPAMVVNMKYNIDGDRQGTSKSTFPDGFFLGIGVPFWLYCRMWMAQIFCFNCP